MSKNIPGLAALALAFLSLPALAEQLTREPIPPIADFRVVSTGPSWITLGWTTPGDPNTPIGQPAELYELWISTDPFPMEDPDAIADWMIGASPVEGLPRPGLPGTPVEFTVGGLPGGTRHFAIRYSTLNMTSAFVTMWGSAGEADTGPPAPILDLRITSIDEAALTLAWTAPGGNPDGSGAAAEYALRFRIDRPILMEADFDAATPVPCAPPQPAGTTQFFTMSGLAPDLPHYIAMKSCDDRQQWSALSNPSDGTPIADTPGGGSAEAGCAGAAAGFSLSLLILLIPVALSWHGR